MLVNIKVTGGLNIELGQIDPKATGGLRSKEGSLSESETSRSLSTSHLCVKYKDYVKMRLA